MRDRDESRANIAYYRVVASGDPYVRRFATREDAEAIMRAINRRRLKVVAFTETGKAVR